MPTLTHPIAKRSTSATVGSMNFLYIYRHLGTWCYDDPRSDIIAEPFVQGADKIIDHALAGEGFSPDTELVKLYWNTKPRWTIERLSSEIRNGEEWNHYRLLYTDITGWLCPQLLAFFSKAPEKLDFCLQKLDAKDLEFLRGFPNHWNSPVRHIVPFYVPDPGV